MSFASVKGLSEDEADGTYCESCSSCTLRDEIPVGGRPKNKHSLLCLLEAFEHVNDVVLLVQTKFSSR